MTDYLADVVMPPPEPEETIAPEGAVDEPIDEPVDPVDEPEEDELDLSDEEIVIEPVKKEKISQEEIFAPKVLPVAEPPPAKVPKKTRKKGRVMTEKQLEALAKARAKGIETRKRNAAEKKKMKEMEKEEKNLIKEQKVKKFNKLKKSVEDDIDEVNPAKVAAAPTGYSQEQLDAAVAAAVEKSVNRVEVLRKERKKVKKAAAAKEQHDAKVFHEINSAIKAKDVWDQCFM